VMTMRILCGYFLHFSSSQSSNECVLVSRSKIGNNEVRTKVHVLNSVPHLKRSPIFEW
jgi:hypothetical protein